MSAITPSAPAKHTIRLRNRFSVAERTLALQFDKPAGFAFRPGQCVDLTLLHSFPADAGGKIHTFSLANAPHEDVLMIATRLRDTAFKRELSKMPLGTEVQIEGPSGSLVLHNNPARAAVLLAGGIGVTPIRSILLYAAKEKLPHRILFFYANRRPEDAAFLDELIQLERQNPNYTLVPTMTQMDKSTRPWTGERGHIDQALLTKRLREVKSPIYYIVGPPGLVNGLRGLLSQTGIDEDEIRTEDFAGY